MTRLSSAPKRILTTHVGSLVRPPELVNFLRRHDRGARYDKREFEICLHDSVAAVVRAQQAAGIDIVSDGEFGKTMSWSRYVLERLGGFEERATPASGVRTAIAGKDRRDFAEFYDEYEAAEGFAGIGKQTAHMGTWVVTGPIRYTGAKAIARDIANLKAAIKGRRIEGFLPVVAPASVAPSRVDEYYKTPDDALFAIAKAMNSEYRAVIDAGLHVQIDDAFLTSSYDLMVPPQRLTDYRKWAAVRIEALNVALEGIPQERSRYHLCWGSWNGPHTNDVPLADIVDLMLKVRVGGYSIEMANPRHEHEWRVWESVKLPAGKTLLPGLVTHATNIVEHPELVCERIVRLAKLVGRENVTASTDCGFAQGPFTRRVHPSIMWAKLRALSEGARLATKALWRPASRTPAKKTPTRIRGT
jgi:5-methyltetrahydropteroyltriglutamate--homocysteine methyltransferase